MAAQPSGLFFAWHLRLPANQPVQHAAQPDYSILAHTHGLF